MLANISPTPFDVIAGIVKVKSISALCAVLSLMLGMGRSLQFENQKNLGFMQVT